MLFDLRLSDHGNGVLNLVLHAQLPDKRVFRFVRSNYQVRVGVEESRNIIRKDVTVVFKSFIIGQAPVSKFFIPDTLGILKVDIIADDIFCVELLSTHGYHFEYVSLLSKALNSLLAWLAGSPGYIVFVLNFTLALDYVIIRLRSGNILERTSQKLDFLLIFRLV